MESSAAAVPAKSQEVITLPEPGEDNVPVGLAEDVAGIVLAEDDWSRLDDIEAWARGMESVAESYGHDVTEARKVWRFVEVRRGELAGPEVEHGGDRKSEDFQVSQVKVDASPASVSRWRKMARNRERVVRYLFGADEKDEVTQAAVLRFIDGDDQPHNTQSKSNEWYTPARYIEAARRVMGGIDLDPASCLEANEIVQADTFYTAAQDGLEQEWYGRVWLNPPWGDKGPKFVKRAVQAYERGRIEQAVLLVNAHSTETNWFAPLWDHLLCFTDHRIDYVSPQEKTSASTHGSVFVYLGDDHQTFADEFRQFGYIVSRWTP